LVAKGSQGVFEGLNSGGGAGELVALGREFGAALREVRLRGIPLALETLGLGEPLVAFLLEVAGFGVEALDRTLGLDAASFEGMEFSPKGGDRPGVDCDLLLRACGAVLGAKQALLRIGEARPLGFEAFGFGQPGVAAGSEARDFGAEVGIAGAEDCELLALLVP
jgi:hypothetical protein